MSPRLLILLVAALLYETCSAAEPQPFLLTVDNPRTEYIENPVGIGQYPPRLGWEVKSAQRGCLQTAYQVQAASTAEKLAAGECDLWESGRVSSDNSTQVAYSGKPLSSGARAYPRTLPDGHASIVAQAAAVLGNMEDVQVFTALAQEIKGAFNKAFYNEKWGGYGEDSQTANAFPLAIGLVPSEREAEVLSSLIKNIVEVRHNHISSGIVGTRFVMDVLSKRGRSDVAYAMAAQPDFPGWGNLLKDGNTTLTEEWTTNDSRNHPAFTCVSGWFYRSLAGIDTDDSAPGYKNILIKPAVVGDLTFAKASLHTVRGLVTSEWSEGNGVLKFHVTVPGNSTAKLSLPASAGAGITEDGRPVTAANGIALIRRDSQQAVYTLGSGDYHFEVRELAK